VIDLRGEVARAGRQGCCAMWESRKCATYIERTVRLITENDISCYGFTSCIDLCLGGIDRKSREAQRDGLRKKLCGSQKARTYT
jgi:hypothetical protein